MEMEAPTWHFSLIIKLHEKRIALVYVVVDYVYIKRANTGMVARLNPNQLVLWYQTRHQLIMLLQAW